MKKVFGILFPLVFVCRHQRPRRLALADVSPEIAAHRQGREARQPQKRSDANFQFQLYGQLGQTFTVEASTNFNTWTSVTSFVANTLPMDVVDLSASNHPSRLYRAWSPP